MDSDLKQPNLSKELKEIQKTTKEAKNIIKAGHIERP